MPGATARGANAAGIERLGDTGQASDARSWMARTIGSTLAAN